MNRLAYIQALHYAQRVHIVKQGKRSTLCHIVNEVCPLTVRINLPDDYTLVAASGHQLLEGGV